MPAIAHDFHVTVTTYTPDIDSLHEAMVKRLPYLPSARFVFLNPAVIVSCDRPTAEFFKTVRIHQRR